MSDQRSTITLDQTELESLLRRLVREEVDRRLGRVSEDWSHEGPEDLKGDRRLCDEALEVLGRHEDDPGAWTTLEDFQKELDEADPARKLPH